MLRCRRLSLLAVGRCVVSSLLRLLASIRRPECPVEIAQPDAEFRRQFPAGAEIAGPAVTGKHPDVADFGRRPSFKKHHRVERTAVYDGVEAGRQAASTTLAIAVCQFGMPPVFSLRASTAATSSAPALASARP